MPAKVKVKVKGFRQFEKNLASLRPITAKKTVEAAAMRALKPVALRARAKADRVSGALQDSITVSTNAVDARKKSPVEVYVGPGQLPQAITEEFGTIKQQPDPFMRPAWDSLKYSVLEQFAFNLEIKLDYYASRAAKRTAREARRIKQGK